MMRLKQRLVLSLAGLLGLAGVLLAWWEPSGEADAPIQAPVFTALKADFRPDITSLGENVAEFELSERQKTARVADVLKVGIEPLALPQIQSTLLDPDTLLLEYSLGESRSVLWLVSSNSIQSYALPGRATIEEAARRVRELLARGGSRDVRGSLDLALLRLSAIILEPFADRLRTKNLVIVADGPLSQVPFAALSVAGATDEGLRPLGLDHSVVNLPSISTLAPLRQRMAHPKTAKGIAILADPVLGASDPRLQRRTTAELGVNGMTLPRLAYSQVEAQNIVALARVKTFTALGFAANRRTVLEGNLRGYEILHFATHASPDSSGLLLSAYDSDGRPQDPLLRGDDIDRLNLNAALVVLSACSSGMFSTDGMMPLAEHFLRGGSSRVLVSYWAVEDQATAELMSAFYRFLLQKNFSPAAALHAAQVEIQRQPRWRSPYYWAGFGLYGDWR